MRTMLVVGLFFLFLSIVFGVAAWRGGAKSGAAGLTPADKARRNVAVVFAVVGLALVLVAVFA